MEFYIKLSIVTVLLLLGIYLYYGYRESETFTLIQRKRYRMMRYTGIALLVIAFGLCIYFYYTETVSFKATMNGNACNVCKLYAQRSRALRPYSIGEYKRLQQHTLGCRLCSKECAEMMEDAKRLGMPAEKIKTECVNTTITALKAQKELDRLTGKMREKQLAYWRATKPGTAPPTGLFPQVPK